MGYICVDVTWVSGLIRYSFCPLNAITVDNLHLLLHEQSRHYHIHFHFLVNSRPRVVISLSENQAGCLIRKNPTARTPFLILKYVLTRKQFQPGKLSEYASPLFYTGLSFPLAPSQTAFIPFNETWRQPWGQHP